MKHMCVLGFVLLLAGTALGQESDVTTETSTTTTVSGAADLLPELWLLDDATVLDTGRVELRFTFSWETADFPANGGNSDDDLIIRPSLVWGPCANVEVFAEVPIWVGDGGDRGALTRGNADTNIGFTWRIAEPEDIWPAAALQFSARVPTGDQSSGVDGEARLILTNEYDSGVRSHFNVFAKTVNGDNEVNSRDFQYGAGVGLDGPLCADGAVRWVMDYMNRSSFHDGASSLNLLEAGWQWTISDAQALGMSFQAGLDNHDDTPDFGASITYAHALTY